MLKLNEKQKELLLRYLPELGNSVVAGDINSVLDKLDEKITEIGFNADYSLNKVGLQLQRLYDELYDQN